MRASSNSLRGAGAAVGRPRVTAAAKGAPSAARLGGGRARGRWRGPPGLSGEQEFGAARLGQGLGMGGGDRLLSRCGSFSPSFPSSGTGVASCDPYPRKRARMCVKEQRVNYIQWLCCFLYFVCCFCYYTRGPGVAVVVIVVTARCPRAGPGLAPAGTGAGRTSPRRALGVANSQRHRFQVERQKDGGGGEKGCGAMADQFKGSPIV